MAAVRSGRGAAARESQAVSTGYFRTMGIELREGRVFGIDDNNGSQPVAIVNERMVRGFWQGESPIGEHLILGAPRPGIQWLNDCRRGGGRPNWRSNLRTTSGALHATRAESGVGNGPRYANEGK